MNRRQGLAVVALALTAVSPAAANVEIYRRVAPATVQIVGPDLSWVGGTGSLIDAGRRWVVTADHVIANLDRGKWSGVVGVIFAQLDRNKHVITDAKYYERHKQELVIPGKVIARDRQRDLAIIELQQLPKGVPPLALSADGPEPSETIHVIGMSSRIHGGAFGYCSGQVRNVFLWEPFLDTRVVRVVAHQAPTNKGDSGGPAVNDRGELVAVISTGTIGEPGKPGQWTYQQQVIDHSTHVSELRSLLEELKNKTTGDAFQQPGGETFSVSALALPESAGVDVYTIACDAGQRVEVELRGDGRSDLDLWIFDDKGSLLVQKIGLSDQEDGQFLPARSGLYTIKVMNLGKRDVNRYKLTAQRGKDVKGPITLRRSLGKQDADTFKFQYEAGQPARVTLRSDADSDLDLIVEDVAGKSVGKVAASAEQQDVSWRPTAAGVYTIRVRNQGSTWSRYTLTTN